MLGIDAEAILMLKVAYDNEIVNFSKLRNISLEEDALNILNEIIELWTGKVEPLELDYDIDEETGEFVDYTGIMILDFLHPRIKDFFKILSIKDIKLEDFIQQYIDESDLIIYSIKDCFFSFLDHFFINEAGECANSFQDIVGMRFIFDSINNTHKFLEYLIKYVECCEMCIEEYQLISTR